MSVLLGGLVVTTTACGGAETDDTVGEDVTLPDTAAFRGRRFHGRVPHGGAAGTIGTGGTAGTSGTGGTGAGPSVGPIGGCDLCAKTQQCCVAATGGAPVCSFSAATCSTLDPVTRDAYVNNCLVFLKAFLGARVDPPIECR